MARLELEVFEPRMDMKKHEWLTEKRKLISVYWRPFVVPDSGTVTFAGYPQLTSSG